MTTITKYELAEYSTENGDTVKIYDSLEALKSDLPNYFGWISDNEPDKELPDFSDCETIQDINSVLKEWDYSYWNLEANKIEWNIDDERVWVDEVNQRTLSDKEYFEMLERESQELGVSFEKLIESEDQYKPFNKNGELWIF